MSKIDTKALEKVFISGVVTSSTRELNGKGKAVIKKCIKDNAELLLKVKFGEFNKVIISAGLTSHEFSEIVAIRKQHLVLDRDKPISLDELNKITNSAQPLLRFNIYNLYCQLKNKQGIKLNLNASHIKTDHRFIRNGVPFLKTVGGSVRIPSFGYVDKGRYKTKPSNVIALDDVPESHKGLLERFKAFIGRIFSKSK